MDLEFQTLEEKVRKEEKPIHFQKYIKQLKDWIEDFKSEYTDLGHTY